MKHGDDVWSPKFSPDGQYLAVGSGRSQVFLWKWGAHESERQLIKKVEGCTRSLQGNSACEIEWSSDSKFFATRWEKNVLAYNTKGEVCHSYHQDDDIFTIQWSADAKFIAVGSNNYSIIFDAESNQRVRLVEGACRH